MKRFGPARAPVACAGGAAGTPAMCWTWVAEDQAKGGSIEEMVRSRCVMIVGSGGDGGGAWRGGRGNAIPVLILDFFVARV